MEGCFWGGERNGVEDCGVGVIERHMYNFGGNEGIPRGSGEYYVAMSITRLLQGTRKVWLRLLS